MNGRAMMWRYLPIFSSSSSSAQRCEWKQIFHFICWLATSCSNFYSFFPVSSLCRCVETSHFCCCCCCWCWWCSSGYHHLHRRMSHWIASADFATVFSSLNSTSMYYRLFFFFFCFFHLSFPLKILVFCLTAGGMSDSMAFGLLCDAI